MPMSSRTFRLSPNNFANRNQALTKRLSDLEKRQQKKLEKQQPATQAGGERENLAEAMAADLPYKAAVKATGDREMTTCAGNGVCVYGKHRHGF